MCVRACVYSTRQKQNPTFSSVSLHTEPRRSSVVARCRLLMKAPDWSGGSLIGSCHAGSLPSKPQSLLGDAELGPLAVSRLLVATVWILIVMLFALNLLCKLSKRNELGKPLRGKLTFPTATATKKKSGANCNQASAPGKGKKTMNFQ